MPATALAYGRIYHTNMVTQIQIAGFKNTRNHPLKEYTDAVPKPETYYARNILSIMPEQYKVSKEDCYVYKDSDRSGLRLGMTRLVCPESLSQNQGDRFTGD